MLNSKVYILGALALCFLVHGDTLACSCSPIDGSLSDAQLVRQARKKADAVFTGKVIAIREFGTDTLAVSFKVDRVWKGKIPNQAVVLTDSDKIHCQLGVPFREGERYIVYAEKAYTSLVTSICTRTVKVSESLLDVKILGRGKTPETKNNGD
ncbi:MAG TPA: hypothetical protein VF656_11230 [Pyrinomonadaceae bacterium]|jgi:hypothetical protein